VLVNAVKIRISSSSSAARLLWGLAVTSVAVVGCGATGQRKPDELEGSATAGNSSGAGGTAGALASAGGTAGALAGGTAGDASAGAPGVPVACPELVDPQSSCPASSPEIGATCQNAALCDYDSCGDGCFSSFLCADAAVPWSGAIRVCGGGACDASLSSDEPWRQAHSLTFARTGGDCGALGSLDYDSGTNQLGALSCSVALDEQNGCVWRRVLDCSLESTQLTIDAKVAFRARRGWRGEASVGVVGEAPCEGTYLLAL
jgi:hypothetical protein